MNFTSSLRAARQIHGEAFGEQVLERVAGEGGEALRLGGVVTSGWYPVAWWRAYLEALDDALGGDPEALARLARTAAQQDLKLLFRMARLVLKPEVAAKQVRFVHGRYVRGGSAEAVEARPGRLRIVFRECHGFDGRCWRDYLAGVAGVLEGLGATAPTLEGPPPRSGSFCDAVIVWAT